jgi:putative N6-adenine-specific DNA methylase
MCGSGTLLIEAALIARNMAPGIFRKEYAFEKWEDFDRDLFDEIYNDDSKETEFTHHIYGYDIDFKAVNIAKENVKSAGLAKDISIEQQDFADMPGLPNAEQYMEQNLTGDRLALIVTNPPYGERISTPNLLETYKMIGRQLKHNFKGCEAWVLSCKEECFAQIGLKPSLKIPLYNGSLECEYRKYLMFDGRLENFREEGGVVKTDEEKKRMAEKRKSWQKHDFEKRREERQSNEDADILSFEFHSLKKQRGRDDRDRDREFDRNRDRDRGRDRDRDRDKGRDRDRDRDKGRDRDRGRNRDWKSQDGDDDYRHQFKGKSYKSRDERQEDRKKFFQKKK